jgi:2-succinyl-5-enolpyruvyl-6-hydroxy-3-cyclohexene-1-carboxylate synthase
MTNHSSKSNTHFSHVLFSTFKSCFIDHVFVAPGSRSSPLSLAAQHYAEKIITHFDERSLAFMALGKIKSDLKPAIVITTSGSAVGNLLPALMEAFAQKLPLILITADRPHDYHNKGSNQTLKQSDLFAPFTVFSTSFDSPSGGFHDKALSSLISFISQKCQEGPIHINIPLHEPLFDPSVDFPHDVEFRKEHKSLEHIVLEPKQGIMILGENAVNNLEDAIFYESLGDHLDIPIFADITSGYRSYGLKHLHYYPLILEALNLKPKYVLHFGKKITSKTLEQFIKNHNDDYLHITDDLELYDPYHKISHTYRVPKDTFSQLLKGKEANDTLSIQSLYELNHLLEQKLSSIISEYPSYEEAMYVKKLAELDLSHLQIFVGNSLPIRHMDSFYFPKQASCKVFTQRGCSGIDGLISTACGLSIHGILTLALLGDLSSLYDINALSLISENKLPIIPVIFNNHGGGIFSYLPIVHQTTHFEKIIATSHGFNFRDLAHGFDLDHIHISSLEEFESFLKSQAESSLVEIVSDRQGNPQFLDHIKDSLCSFIKDINVQLTLQSSSTDF